MASVEVDYGELSETQVRFCQSKRRRVGFGGSRGGGKTHVLCVKSTQLGFIYEGINILIVRRTFPELNGEIVPKLMSFVGKIAKYNTQNNRFTFPNGSTITLRHYSGEGNAIDFQGMNYDIIFMDEATQFSESMYRVLTMCNRLSGRVDIKKHPNFYPRMYFTANPGGRQEKENECIFFKMPLLIVI